MEELKLKKKNTKIYNKNGKNNKEEEDSELAININGKENLINVDDENNIDTSSKKNQNDNNINTDELKLKVDLNSNNSENLKITSDSGSSKIGYKKEKCNTNVTSKFIRSYFQHLNGWKFVT